MALKPLPVLIVEDDRDLREALTDTLQLAGYEVRVVADGSAALKLLEGEPVGLVVSDVQMQPMDGHTLLKHIKASHAEIPVLLMTAYGMIEKAVEAMRDGACNYITKPFEADKLLSEVARFMLTASPDEGGEVIAEDAMSRDLLALAKRVAASNTTVLVTGESGTGKEVMARYLHRHSPRAAKPFVAINCAAIPDNLLEATLFGHEKGAFTGATASQAGKFEQANGGTLLLDEISEMPLGLQAKLLRVLQEREVERVGGKGPVPVDVRIIATSNRDMEAEVAAGRFREDLFFRLNVFPLRLLALRERKQDILPLVRHILARLTKDAGRRGLALSPEAELQLTQYAWPGNIRELENVLQRALILAPGNVIEPAHLYLPAAKIAAREQPVSAPRAVVPATGSVSAPVGQPTDIKSLERQHIMDALAATGGSRKQAAERLGMSERTLRYKLARYREEDGSAGEDQVAG